MEDSAPGKATSVTAILEATRQVIAERGPEKFTMSAIAAAAGVSRPTLYRWFPTKAALLTALTRFEEDLFDARLVAVISEQRSPGRRLDAALRFLVTYLDGLMGPDPIGVDPGFAIQSLANSLSPHVTSFVRLLGDAFDTVPAVRLGHLTREQAAEMFLRVAYSHYLIPHPEPQVLLANMRSLAGMSRRSITRGRLTRRYRHSNRGGAMSMVDEVIAEARSRTGLTDLGQDSFHEGLVALLDGAEQAGSFNELGLAVLRDQAIGFLVTRLSVEDWYARHPEIDEQELLAPLVGLGLPRTGSTALAFLLAEDSRSRPLLTWESFAPTPPPDPATYATDPRIAEAALQISVINEMAPKFKSMLPSSPTGPTECLPIMALDFRSAMFGALGDNRHYERWLAQCDMVSAYRYHARVLKLLQWKLPSRPWHLRTPAHMDSIGALVAVYPDARFVMTHRDIVQVIPSLVSLFDATSELLRTGPLAADFAENQAAYWERALRKTIAYRDAGNDDRFFDIGFAEMRPDPIPAIERFYEWLGVDLTDEVAERMRTWWETNPADKQGVHEYDPDQYGIDLDDLRRQFAFYNDRYVSA